MANRPINIEGIDPSSGQLILSDNGNTNVDPGDTVTWNILNNSGVASITNIVDNSTTDLFSIGIKKWQYDIWGETVNIASRMESNSKPGKINLSETSYQQIKDEFSCEYRGEIEVKNRGSMKMYFLIN